MKFVIFGLGCALADFVFLLMAMSGGLGDSSDVFFKIAGTPFLHLVRIPFVADALRLFGRDPVDIAVLLNVALWGVIGWWASKAVARLLSNDRFS